MKQAYYESEIRDHPEGEFRLLKSYFTGFKGLLRALIALNVIGLLGVGVTVARAAETSELLMVPMVKSETTTETQRKPLKADILSTRINSRITGHIIRTTVVQTFKNPTADWMEGVYYFPLPDDASVDRMTLTIGERRIVSEIKEKEEARKTYIKAAAEGKITGLLTQYRPNMFSTRVANIEPGTAIGVEISFQSLAGQDGGRFTWVMPQAITPRFTPLPSEGTAHTVNLPAGSQGSKAFPPETAYDPEGGKNLTEFLIEVRQADRFSSVSSPSHEITEKRDEHSNAYIRLATGRFPADRDFILNWELAQSESIEPVLFQEVIGEELFTLGYLVPPKPDTDIPALPRDVTFILDVSGSMHGESLDQAKAALSTALDLLTPQDRFDIIIFSNDYRRLFGNSRVADPSIIRRAKSFVGGLKANGGTHMYPALQNALGDTPTEGTQRQVLFLTDGAVGNEEEMFRLVNDQLGNARLFTVGVGNAPNGWFMRKAAEFGRGTHVQISDLSMARQKLETLFRDMARPTLQNVSIKGSATADIYPRQSPDLFGQRPLVFSAKTLISDGPLQISGEIIGGQKLEFDLPETEIPQGADIAKLWASKKVEGLSDAKARGMDAEIVREASLQVALKHQIMSPYTSFIAVDKTPVRVQEELMRKMIAKANMPAGLSWKKIHGPQTATAMELYLLAGGILVSFALFFLWFRSKCKD